MAAGVVAGLVRRRMVSIRRILDHLGLSPLESAKSPRVREILRVAEQREGSDVPADWH